MPGPAAVLVELSAAEREQLERWARRPRERAGAAAAVADCVGVRGWGDDLGGR